MIFKVGDWVRWKATERAGWPHGNKWLRITAVAAAGAERPNDISVSANKVRKWWLGYFDHRPCPKQVTAPAFDPHALGMALELADEVGRDAAADWDDKHYLLISRWLRACVTEALLSQEGE